MKMETLNPHVIKIMIAARKEDSIRAISKRIGLSYGWTYRWAAELEEAGVFKRTSKKIFLNETAPFYRKVVALLRDIFSRDVVFHYNVLAWFGIKYCFTGIDAVFAWTDGGYNIARSMEHYPIFIKVRKEDREILGYYTRKLGLKGKIFYKPVFLDDFPISFHEEIPVDSLEETIKFMKKYIYNFQPALEMVQEMYGKAWRVRYKEAATNV
ncbi:MAG: hypothetical protein HYX24_01995 [Candidatus Aenigmarchaeota archaeon]|nr:hypothetical protein [Candidatus Aenigmarchaeota archaeon]